MQIKSDWIGHNNWESENVKTKHDYFFFFLQYFLQLIEIQEKKPRQDGQNIFNLLSMSFSLYISYYSHCIQLIFYLLNIISTISPTFAQIPHPIHSSSEINAILSVGLTSIHNLPRSKICMYKWNSIRYKCYNLS